MVCYKFAVGTCEKGNNCEYAHDIELAKKYLHMKVKYYTDSKWYKPAPGSNEAPRLSLFVVEEREEEDWYEFQRLVLEEEAAAAEEQLEEQGDYGEEYEDDEGAVDGYGAPSRS